MTTDLRALIPTIIATNEVSFGNITYSELVWMRPNTSFWLDFEQGTGEQGIIPTIRIWGYDYQLPIEVACPLEHITREVIPANLVFRAPDVMCRTDFMEFLALALAPVARLHIQLKPAPAVGNIDEVEFTLSFEDCRDAVTGRLPWKACEQIMTIDPNEPHMHPIQDPMNVPSTNLQYMTADQTLAQFTWKGQGYIGNVLEQTVSGASLIYILVLDEELGFIQTECRKSDIAPYKPEI